MGNPFRSVAKGTANFLKLRDKAAARKKKEDAKVQADVEEAQKKVKEWDSEESLKQRKSSGGRAPLFKSVSDSDGLDIVNEGNKTGNRNSKSVSQGSKKPNVLVARALISRASTKDAISPELLSEAELKVRSVL
jgi:hypothetical protein